MRRSILTVTVVLLAAGTVLAGQNVTVTKTTSDGNSVVVSESNGQWASGYTLSVVDRVGADSMGRYLTMGKLPPALDILDLTDEQKKSLEGVAAAAKQERSELYKEWRETSKVNRKKPGTYTQNWQEWQKKNQALTDKYVARVMDLLTEEQKKLLEKIFEIGEKKKAEIAKINEEMMKARQKVNEKYEAELAKVVPEKELAALKEALKPKFERHVQGGNPTTVTQTKTVTTENGAPQIHIQMGN